MDSIINTPSPPAGQQEAKPGVDRRKQGKIEDSNEISIAPDQGAQRQEVDDDQRFRSLNRKNTGSWVLRKSAEPTKLPPAEVVVSSKLPATTRKAAELPSGERAISGKALGTGVVEALRNKKCIGRNVLNALADASCGPSSSSLRNMVFNNDCSVGIDEGLAGLKRDELRTVAGRIKGPWMQALIKALNDDPNLAFDIDPDPKSAEFFRDLRSTLRMIDQKVQLPSKKPSEEDLAKARFELKDFYENRKFLSLKQNEKATEEGLKKFADVMNEQIKPRESLFDVSPGEAAGSGASETAGENPVGLGPEGTERFLALLGNANIVVRNGCTTTILAVPKQEQADPTAVALSSLKQLLGAEQGLKVAQCLSVIESAEAGDPACVLASHQGESIASNIVIDASDEGAVNVLARLESRFCEGTVRTDREQISNRPVNPNFSYHRTTIDVSIPANDKAVANSITYDSQIVPLANDFFEKESSELASRYRASERASFAGRNKVAERVLNHSELAEKGAQFECASKLESYVCDAGASVASRDLPREGNSELSTLLHRTRISKEQLVEDKGSDRERIAWLMVINDAEVADMRDCQAQVKRFDKAQEIDADLIADTKTALIEVRTIQGNCYRELELLTEFLEEPQNREFLTEFKDEIDISLGLHVAILAQAERVGSELEMKIVDVIEDSYPRGEICEAIQAIGEDRRDFATKQKEALVRALGTVKHMYVEQKVDGKILKSREQIQNLERVFAKVGKVVEKLDPAKCGPGLKKKDYQVAAKAVAKVLKNRDQLPENLHGLNAGQAIELAVVHYAKKEGVSTKNSKLLVRDINRETKKTFTARLAQNWSQVSHKFSDTFKIKGLDRRVDLEVTSTITPRLHKRGDGQVAVPAGARSQGKHICNLAHTQLTGKEKDSEGEDAVIFSGLRHGVLDAYEISKTGIRNMTSEQRNQLLVDTKLMCRKLVQGSRNPERLERKIDRLGIQGFYLRTAEGRDILRRAANANAAVELVREAVERNPIGVDQVVERNPIGVDQVVVRDPIGEDQVVVRDPIGEDQVVERDPIGEDQVVERDPIGEDQVVERDPIGEDQVVERDPIGEDQVVERDPIGEDQVVERNPIGEDQVVKRNPIGVFLEKNSGSPFFSDKDLDVVMRAGIYVGPQLGSRNPMLGINTRNGISIVEGKAKALDININSISLLTPDPIRRSLNLIKKKIMGKDKAGSSERKMLLHQKRAFQDLNRAYPNGITIDFVVDGEVYVGKFAPHFRLMNFSVNEFAVKDKGAGKILKKIGLMGWRKSNRYNTGSIHALTGVFEGSRGNTWGEAFSVLKYVADKHNLGVGRESSGDTSSDEFILSEDIPELREEKKARIDWVINNNKCFREDPGKYYNTVSKLGTQINSIYESGSHENAGHEPYKLAARVAVLSFLLGEDTAYNCKSGKDRTGALDMEIKSLAAKVSVGEVPEPDLEPTNEDRVRKTTYALKTGNLEMQKYNTGLRGYKLFGVPALFEQLESGLAVKLFSGDSKLVKD